MKAKRLRFGVGRIDSIKKDQLNHSQFCDSAGVSCASKHQLNSFFPSSGAKYWPNMRRTYDLTCSYIIHVQSPGSRRTSKSKWTSRLTRHPPRLDLIPDPPCSD